MRATLAHVVRNVEAWSDLMAGRPVRDDGGRSVPELIERLDRAADDLAEVSRTVAGRGAWDETWTDPGEDPPVERTWGASIAHVVTHGMHHRAQVLDMLRALGLADLPEGDVLSWEAAARPGGRTPDEERRREPTRKSSVTLREIDADNVRAICNLAPRPDQVRFVAPNAVSIAQAYFDDQAWFRAVFADETPVGFVMLQDRPEEPEYYLWRFMIDARWQRMGFGRRAIALLVEHVKRRPGATELLTSVVQEEGGPQPFYEGLGFEATGAYEQGEALLRLRLR